MARVGETILVVNAERNGKVALDTKIAEVRNRVVVMRDSDGNKIAVRALNTYEKDDGLVVTLPCGTKAFLPSEPPDYYQNTQLSQAAGGLGCSACQGPPETNGWICNSTCGFRASLGKCSRYYGYSMNPANGSACTHAIGSTYWRGNAYIHDIEYWYGCPYMPCPEYPKYINGKLVSGRCTTYNSEHYARVDMNGNLVENRMNCLVWDRLVMVQQNRTWWYSCTPVRGGSTCPYFNGGWGQPTCMYDPASPPPFQPGDKPAACLNPGGLVFTGWDVPGGSASNEIRCVFSKATEGNKGTISTSSGFGDDKIQCVFSVM